MDYEGQRLSELIFYWVILLCGGVGWIIGYMRQEFFIVFKFWLVGVVISIVVRTDASWKIEWML
jgi:signal peptidase complex subunit 1